MDTIPRFIDNKIYNAFAWILHDIMKYKIVREKEGIEIASGNVSIQLERIAAQDTYEYRNYVSVIYYIERLHDYEEEFNKSENFSKELLRQIYINANNLGAAQVIYFAGCLLIDVNDRLQGLKFLFALGDKV